MAERFSATSEEYHASPGTSHSQLETFIKKPKLFYQYFVREPRRERTETADQKFGRETHAHVLEQTTVKIPWHVLAKNGAKSGNAWRQFALQHEGKLLLKEHEYGAVEAVAAAIRENERARHLIYEAEGEAEVSIRWVDDVTGMLLRCRLDRLLHRPKLIVDLKAVRSAVAGDFAAVIEEWGYHRQAAMYQDGYEHLSGELLPFVFVAVDKEEPAYAALYDLDAEWIARGRHENQVALANLKAALANDDWRPATSQQIITLKPPAWATRKSQYAA